MLRRKFLTAGSMALTPGLGRLPADPAGPLPAGCRVYNVQEYGALPDGKTLCSRPIQAAVDAAAAAGGGCVYVPPGRYLTGTIELKSFVTLYLEGGSVLLGSPSVDDYRGPTGLSGPPSSGDANTRHLLFARGAQCVTVCGTGTIDGQGQNFWRNKHRAPVPADRQWADVVTFDYEPATDQRPSPMVEFAECRNLRVRDITLANAAGWTLRPIACEDVLLDGIRIVNPEIGPNTDGLDITACSNVLVSNCNIATGDDAICLKSENPYGPLLPTRNITITNCVLTTTCNGFKMGTATHGAFENIVFSNSVIQNPDSSRINERVIGGICIEMVDGGSVDGVLVSGIRMQNVRTPLFMRLGSRTRKPGSFLRNVRIQGVDATGAILTSSITGVPDLRPQDITVSHCRFRSVEAGRAEWADAPIPEVAAAYPEARMMGRLPAAGLYVRHANGVWLDHLELIADRPDARSAVVCDDVHDLRIDGLEASAPEGGAPLVRVHQSQQVFVHGTRLPASADTLLEVNGELSQDVQCSGNAVRASQHEVRYAQGAKPS